jgi:capsular polysaccharide biosynthesis protein
MDSPTVLARLRRRLQWFRRTRPGTAAEEVAVLLRSDLAGEPHPLVALRQPPLPGLDEVLRSTLPSAEIIDVPDDDADARLSLLVRRGPLDAVVEVGGDVDVDRGARFEDTFWHLAPGRPYVVPGGAAKGGRSSGDLATLLRQVTGGPGEPLRARRRRAREHARLALANHVRRRVVGDHLLLDHDLPDVLVKIREDAANTLLIGDDRTRHRLLGVIPAGDAPDPPRYREGPEPRTTVAAPIGRATLSLRDYRGVVVAAPQIVVDGRVLLPDTYRHNQAPVLWHKALADVAPGFAVPRTQIPPDLPLLEGTFVHLDDEARGHFGHLLTETLSRMWSWERALDLDPDARVVVGANRARPDIAEWEYAFYEACGIPRDRIVLVGIGRPVRVERLISGTPMWSQPHYVHPRIRETWRRVGDALALTASVRSDWPRRIFASRRIAKRGCLNGEQLEAEFTRTGFEVVYPEDHPLGDQVALFRNAEVIAGYGGSGMFQSLFVPEPRHLIQVVSEAYSPRNEYLISAVLGHRLDAVVCRAEEFHKRKKMHAPFRYDPEREGPFLRELLESLPH